MELNISFTPHEKHALYIIEQLKEELELQLKRKHISLYEICTVDRHEAITYECLAANETEEETE